MIAESAEKRLNDSLRVLISDAAEFEELTDYEKAVVVNGAKVPVLAVYLAADAQGAPLGYCVEVAPSGYSSEIHMLVALDRERVVTGTQILSISDTPGVGMKVQSDEDFQKSVIGLADIAKIVRSAPSAKTARS